MTREIYEAVADPYAYPESDILINKLGTHDPKELESFELEMTTLRADEPLPHGRLSATHYKNIHHHLFQDVYDWAGKYRKVRIAKDENVFCFPENIENEMRKLFDALKNAKLFTGLTGDQFSNSAARFIADLKCNSPFSGREWEDADVLFRCSRRCGGSPG